MKGFQVDMEVCLPKVGECSGRYGIGVFVRALNCYDACLYAYNRLKKDFNCPALVCHFVKVEEVEVYEESE